LHHVLHCIIAFRIAFNLNSKSRRSYSESLETAVRARLGIRRNNFTPLLRLTMARSDSTRNALGPSLLGFSRYFSARSKRTNWDALFARNPLKNSELQSNQLPSSSVSYLPSPRFEPQACASKTSWPSSCDHFRLKWSFDFRPASRTISSAGRGRPSAVDAQ
jgi:hypothetical protein